MKIEIQNENDGLSHIALEGDLDFHTSPDLRKELTRLVDQQASKIVIDLEKVAYIDSSGLATFVELFQRMKRYNGKLVLHSLAAAVRSVFEIAKLDTIFKLANSKEDALVLISR